MRFCFGLVSHGRRLVNGFRLWLGFDRSFRHGWDFFHRRFGLRRRFRLDGNGRFFDQLDRGNILSSELFDHRFGLDGDFLGGLHRSIDFRAEFVDLRLIARLGLQFGESGQSLLGHAVADIEANLLDGLVDASIGNFGNFRSGFRNLDRCFDGCGRRIVGLDGDRVVPLGGEIDFFAGRSSLGGPWRGRFIYYREFGFGTRFYPGCSDGRPGRRGLDGGFLLYWQFLRRG
jgi:hypothetical protein